jgi:uncharacterized protein
MALSNPKGLAKPERLRKMLRENVDGADGDAPVKTHEVMPYACELPLKNATPAEVRLILSMCRTIAMVGLSDKPDRDSYHVAAYLQQQGFRIIPVNPNVTEVLGEKAYANLPDVGQPVDLVNIFRKPEAVPALVEEAIALRAKAVWMQKGIVHNTAAQRARQAGLQVVMNQCIMIEHQRLQLSRP